MPHTRTTRRQVAKREILGALDENKQVFEALPARGNPADPDELCHNIDGSDAEHVRLLIDDIEKGVKKQQEVITVIADKANQEQQELMFLGSLKLETSIRKMTIRNASKKYGVDVLDMIKSIAQGGAVNGAFRTAGSAGKKRIRSDLAQGKRAEMMDPETPARSTRAGTSMKTPATAIRTIKRGEAMYSKNGSPIDQAEEGDLIATVSKKRRGNNAAVFDINVGDGRYINLSDPGTLDHLNEDMKNSAISHLQTLQDKMAKLLAELGN